MNAKQIAERIVNKSGSYQEVMTYAEGMISPLIARAAELEARIMALEAERDAFAAENDAVHRAVNEMCGTDTSTIEAVQQVIQQRDEWKDTAENQNAHLELARKDFMRRLSVVTHLWFNAKCERDKAQQQLAAFERMMSVALNEGDGTYKP